MGCPGLHCGGCGAKGGALGGAVALGVLVAVGAYLWSSADAALEGARESTAEANLIVAWLVGGAVATVLVAGAIGLLLFRRRRAIDAPAEQAWSAGVDRALATHRSGQLRGARATPAISPPPRRPVPATAQRLDHRPDQHPHERTPGDRALPAGPRTRTRGIS